MLNCPSWRASSVQYSDSECDIKQLQCTRLCRHLTLPEGYKRSSKGEQFLLYDSGPVTPRILIFGTHALRGDPELMKDGHLLSCLFVLPPEKTEVKYTRMWEQVQLLCRQTDPAEMLMDFELAAINSSEFTWPGSVVKGCFFYLTQNLWRWVEPQECKLCTSRAKSSLSASD